MPIALICLKAGFCVVSYFNLRRTLKQCPYSVRLELGKGVRCREPGGPARRRVPEGDLAARQEESRYCVSTGMCVLTVG